MLLIICVERLLHIGSHFSLRKWRQRPHFPTKLAAAASFSNKIGSGKNLATLLAAVLTWSGYWNLHQPGGLAPWGWWDKLSRKYVPLAGLPLLGVKKKKEEPGTGCQCAKFCIEEFSYTE